METPDYSKLNGIHNIGGTSNEYQPASTGLSVEDVGTMIRANAMSEQSTVARNETQESSKEKEFDISQDDELAELYQKREREYLQGASTSLLEKNKGIALDKEDLNDPLQKKSDDEFAEVGVFGFFDPGNKVNQDINRQMDDLEAKYSPDEPEQLLKDLAVEPKQEEMPKAPNQEEATKASNDEILMRNRRVDVRDYTLMPEPSVIRGEPAKVENKSDEKMNGSQVDRTWKSAQPRAMNILKQELISLKHNLELKEAQLQRNFGAEIKELKEKENGAKGEVKNVYRRQGEAVGAPLKKEIEKLKTQIKAREEQITNFGRVHPGPEKTETAKDQKNFLSSFFTKLKTGMQIGLKSALDSLNEGNSPVDRVDIKALAKRISRQIPRMQVSNRSLKHSDLSSDKRIISLEGMISPLTSSLKPLGKSIGGIIAGVKEFFETPELTLEQKKKNSEDLDETITKLGL